MSQNGFNLRKYSAFSLLMVVSGTTKYLVALARPFTAVYTYLRIVTLSSKGIVSVGAASHTTLLAELCFLIKSLPHTLVHLFSLLL